MTQPPPDKTLVNPPRGIPLWVYVFIAAGIMAVAAMLELAMGRRLMCKCGTIHFWVGNVNSNENSQQIADWYSFSHIIHGIALYGLFHLVGRRRWPMGLCFIAAIFLEASWEVLENSSLIINRYRQTMSQDYLGDSVVNSMSDILFCVLGFVLASKLPVWLSISLIVLMELGVGYAIRDNLTLNIIMLIHPFGAIKHWQTARGG